MTMSQIKRGKVEEIKKALENSITELKLTSQAMTKTHLNSGLGQLKRVKILDFKNENYCHEIDT